jgi:putative ABC transport system substrate-binding protein
MLRKAPLTFCLLLCCILMSVFPAAGQQPGKVYRIGVLGAGSSAQYSHQMEVFQQALRDLGWVNERAITFDERWADGRYERLPELVAELVALKVDLILASGGTPAVEAAVRATRKIPIVFPTLADPVAEKFVQSMAHPGGNVTGITNMSTELHPKRVALLKDAMPEIRRVALLFNSANSNTAEAVRSSKAASEFLGIQLQVFDVRAPEEFERAFDSMSGSAVQGVVVGEDGVLLGNLKKVGELALKHRLPLVAAAPDMGVLVAYGRDAEANYRRAATYVDKILKGANPGDLPIEQPTKLNLVINLKTANALGLTVPQSLLLRADEVIR